MDSLAATTGIDHRMESKLATLGIGNTGDLLQTVRTESQRRALAAELGVTHHHVLRWANRADLGRITGLGAIYIHLLSVARIESVQVLATYEPVLLHEHLERVNRARKIVRRMPTTDAVTEWVRQARALGAAVLSN